MCGFRYPDPKREEELKSRFMLLLLIIIPFTESQLLELFRIRFSSMFLLQKVNIGSSMLSWANPNPVYVTVKNDINEIMPM